MTASKTTIATRLYTDRVDLVLFEQTDQDFKKESRIQFGSSICLSEYSDVW